MNVRDLTYIATMNCNNENVDDKYWNENWQFGQSLDSAYCYIYPNKSNLIKLGSPTTHLLLITSDHNPQTGEVPWELKSGRLIVIVTHVGVTIEGNQERRWFERMSIKRHGIIQPGSTPCIIGQRWQWGWWRWWRKWQGLAFGSTLPSVIRWRSSSNVYGRSINI